MYLLLKYSAIYILWISFIPITEDLNFDILFAKCISTLRWNNVSYMHIYLSMYTLCLPFAKTFHDCKNLNVPCSRKKN